MSQEPIDYLNDRIPIGITREMVYKAVINYIYHNILVFGNDVKGILDIDERLARGNFGFSDFGKPLTTGEATSYFIRQYIGDV